jgi:hypothetical protein
VPLQQSLADEQLLPAEEQADSTHLPPLHALLAQSLAWPQEPLLGVGALGPPPQTPALHPPVQQSWAATQLAPALRHLWFVGPLVWSMTLLPAGDGGEQPAANRMPTTRRKNATSTPYVARRRVGRTS